MAGVAMTLDDALAEQVDWMRKARRENPEPLPYRIVRGEDDSLAGEFGSAGADDDGGTAEALLADWSASHPGEFLLLRDGRLMAWARDGVVTSYGPVAA